MSSDPHRALIAALTDYLGPLDHVSGSSHDWSSATFTGMQHELHFTCYASPVFIDALPDFDLPMRDHFVADLKSFGYAVHESAHRVVMEVLTICDA